MNLLVLILITIIIVQLVLYDRLWDKYLAEKEDRLMETLKRKYGHDHQNPREAGQ